MLNQENSMNLSEMKIATRLALGFGAMALLILLLGLLAWSKLGLMDAQFRLAVEDRYPKVRAMSAIKDANNKVAIALANLLVMTEKSDIEAQFAVFESVSKFTASTVADLEKSLTSPGGRAGFLKFQEARASYRVERDKLIKLLRAGDLETAKKVMLKEVQPKQAVYQAALEDMQNFAGSLMDASSKEADEETRSAKLQIVLLIAAAIAVAIVVSWRLIRSITQALDEAAHVASGVAAGDLTMQISRGGSNETGLLMTALHQMQDRLVAMVREVRAGAESVATASAQISSGNQDLSSRTEEQASALEETAASMEQLGSTVRGNADNAHQANQLAMAASEVAVKGGEAVGQVVDTMRDISASSKKIADIIGVIDGIAFQTNILALNAAVEAARAGEQGRGFAVVASEVRTLAGRSAEAAKEIKSLISASVERVELGSSQVDSAGATITEVVASIRRVTDIMGEISAASREQSTGVSQVGEAVTQMDRATQENAALVQESATAAESLKQQAQQLVQAVAVFSLPRT
jgi:methyl-accepting chemotaxis protein